ncbi:MAG TPA: tetratricopeptide repeat protein [Blastocatellia bacterium]|nr:tetratricopeptide repeat protein [Blastocatellia bacterium]
MKISPFTRIHPTRSFAGLFLATAMLTVLSTSEARAQVGGIDSDPGDPGTGGKNTIQGSIFLPGGQRPDARFKVKLTGLASVEQFQFSDDSGSFTFRRLQGGRYTVIVDAGRDYEIANESVDIIEPPRRRNEPGVTVPIHITLQLRGSKLGTLGTVDARTAAVPDAAKDLYKQAMESAKSGDRKKAIEELNKALEIYPNFMSALTELGVQHMQLKQWDKATDALRKAIKISPDAFYPHLNYGIVLVQVKNYKDATSELRFAVQKDGTSAVAQLYLGRALINVGQYDAAESALRHTITIGGNGDEAVEAHRYLGAVYIEKRDSVRAADELDTYLKLAPKAKDAERIRSIIKDLRSQASSKQS